jgi:hypothetical protein
VIQVLSEVTGSDTRKSTNVCPLRDKESMSEVTCVLMDIVDHEAGIDLGVQKIGLVVGIVK